MKTPLVVSDREKALRNSITANIDFAKMKNCIFHLAKNIKDQYAKTGLKAELQNSPELQSQFKDWF